MPKTCRTCPTTKTSSDLSPTPPSLTIIGVLSADLPHGGPLLISLSHVGTPSINHLPVGHPLTPDIDPTLNI